VGYFHDITTKVNPCTRRTSAIKTQGGGGERERGREGEREYYKMTSLSSPGAWPVLEPS